MITCEYWSPSETNGAVGGLGEQPQRERAPDRDRAGEHLVAGAVEHDDRGDLAHGQHRGAEAVRDQLHVPARPAQVPTALAELGLLALARGHLRDLPTAEEVFLELRGDVPQPVARGLVGAAVQRQVHRGERDDHDRDHEHNGEHARADHEDRGEREHDLRDLGDREQRDFLEEAAQDVEVPHQPRRHLAGHLAVVVVDAEAAQALELPSPEEVEHPLREPLPDDPEPVRRERGEERHHHEHQHAHVDRAHVALVDEVGHGAERELRCDLPEGHERDEQDPAEQQPLELPHHFPAAHGSVGGRHVVEHRRPFGAHVDRLQVVARHARERRLERLLVDHLARSRHVLGDLFDCFDDGLRRGWRQLHHAIRDAVRQPATGDEQHRGLRRVRTDAGEDLFFERRVHRAERIVEHEHARRVDECACERDPLALPARQREAAVAERAVQPTVETGDHVVGRGRGQSGAQLGFVAVATEEQVLGKGVGEEERLLAHDADRLAHVRGVELDEVHPVDEHVAPARSNEPTRQRGDGRLARSRRAGDRHHFARCRVNVQAVEHEPAVEAHVDVGERDAARFTRQRRAAPPRGRSPARRPSRSPRASGPVRCGSTATC